MTTEHRQIQEKQVWDQKASTYDEEQALYIDGVYKEVIERMARSLRKEDSVLEIGCGTGLITFGIASQVTRVIAYDLSEKMLEVAQDKAARIRATNIDFKLADGYDLPESEVLYDVVLCGYVLDVVERPKAILKEAHRVLKDKGILITVTDSRKLLRAGFVARLIIRRVLQRMGLIRKKHSSPSIHTFSIHTLRKLHTRSGFSILEEATLQVRDKTANYYLVCQKS